MFTEKKKERKREIKKEDKKRKVKCIFILKYVDIKVIVVVLPQLQIIYYEISTSETILLISKNKTLYCLK